MRPELVTRTAMWGLFAAAGAACDDRGLAANRTDEPAGLTGSVEARTSAVQMQKCHRGPNDPPVVSVGEDVITTEGATISVTAAASDPDCDSLTYQWSFVAGPQSHGLPVTCSLTTPQAPGT